MSRLWLDILISLALYLLAWLVWEVAGVLHVSVPFKAALWELGLFAFNLQDTEPMTFNLLGVVFAAITGGALYLLFKSGRGLIDRLLLSGK